MIICILVHLTPLNPFAILLALRLSLLDKLHAISFSMEPSKVHRGVSIQCFKLAY